MTQTFIKGTAPTVHRLDLTCERTGFTTPPCDVHLKFLPSPTDGTGWTLLAHGAPGKADVLSRWLAEHPGIENIRIAAGIAPKLMRATATLLPTEWATVASFAKVHHLDLYSDGHASWFIEGVRDQVFNLVAHLSSTAPTRAKEDEVRCRPVLSGRSEAPITRRQFETLATAVALGYYEIPHRLDLRALAAHTGLSLGSVSELLRRAEGSILTHYVDANLMNWPRAAEAALEPMLTEGETGVAPPVSNLVRR